MARLQSPDFETKRGLMLDRAAEMFASKGFHGTSIADLAKANGMSKSLLYHYFPSKEKLLRDVMASHIDDLVAATQAVVEERLPAGKQLHALVHQFMRLYVGAADRQKVLLNELDNLMAPDRQEIVAKQRRIVTAVRHMMEAVHPQMAADRSASIARVMLLFGAMNWTANWFDPQGRLPVGQLADMIVDQALAPLSPQGIGSVNYGQPS